MAVLAMLQGHFMHVTNLEDYGHLVNPEGYSTQHLNNDMYEIFNNRKVCAGVHGVRLSVCTHGL